MKTIRIAAAALVMLSTVSAAMAQATQPAAGAGQADIPVKLVVLFSSGVGYFEHFGSVAGDNRTELRFKTQQINDILKSLVLQDLDGGRVTTITYPSQDPISKTLKSFQVDITSNPSLADLLNQLRGAKVTVRQQSEETRGTILGVEKKKKPVGEKEVIEKPVLNLVSESPRKLVAIDLENVADIRFDDAALQEELDRALAALAQARDQDKKPVQIAFEGQGQRRVRVGYVVETPIWKTSYRLILTAKDDKPKLQGWAIVENQTDNDWNDVQLSLVSGRPISFIQDLYQPLYVPRPTVQPELYAGLTPRRYEEGLEAAKKPADRFTMGAGVPAATAAPAPATPPAGAVASRAARARGISAGTMLTDSATLAETPMETTESVASIASAAKVGELFQYTVGNVSLPRQKSAMIPIVTDDIEIERLSIYNQSVLQRNPLNGARVKNTTGKHLLGGPITVFDGNAYAGDAQIDTLPPTQERLISYGIDQQVRVDATKNRTDSALLTGKIVKGVLELQRKNVATQDYVADNKSDKSKTLIIEHPLKQGWSLLDTDKPIETTETLYRFKGKVESGKSSTLTVKEQIVSGERLAILPAELDTLVFYAKAGEIPSDVKEALSKAIKMRRDLATTQRQLDDRKAKVKELTESQTHTAEIVKTLQQNTPVYTRLVTKLNDVQTQIEKVQGEVDELNGTLQEQKNELDNYLANLTVG